MKQIIKKEREHKMERPVPPGNDGTKYPPVSKDDKGKEEEEE